MIIGPLCGSQPHPPSSPQSLVFFFTFDRRLQSLVGGRVLRMSVREWTVLRRNPFGRVVLFIYINCLIKNSSTRVPFVPSFLLVSSILQQYVGWWSLRFFSFYYFTYPSLFIISLLFFLKDLLCSKVLFSWVLYKPGFYVTYSFPGCSSMQSHFKELCSLISFWDFIESRTQVFRIPIPLQFVFLSFVVT